jgi:hypothetical protein
MGYGEAFAGNYGSRAGKIKSKAETPGDPA